MESTKFEPNQEIFVILNSLGYLQDGVYYKEPDCNACLKDLLRFMRTENQYTFATRRQLGNSNFILNDLAPLVKQHCLNDKTLFDYVLRLLSSLTTPPILLFKEQVPDDREIRKIYLDLQQHVFNYKTDLSTDVMFWSVIAKQMLKILQMEQNSRQEEDKVMLERMLILIRNVLHVSSLDEEDVIAGEDNTHDKLMISMKKACIYDILIYICQTDAEHDFAFHVLEIFSLMFREQSAESLATLTDSLRLSETEKRKEIEQIKDLKARTGSNRNHHDYQRFKESTYVVKNFKSIGNNDMICHKPVSDISELNLDQNKKVVRKAKNRRHFQDQNQSDSHTSSLELKSYLRDLATTFISTSFNQLMKTIRYYLERSKSQENDETYFLWATHFFMEFNRCSDAKVDFVMETLSKEHLHYLHCLIESFLDHIKTDKKNVKQWSKRLHNGLKAYKELIYTLAHLQSKPKNFDSPAYQIADDVKRKLFYEEDYRELIRLLIMVYDPIKMSDSYLNDLIEANHLFLRMLESHCKKNENQVMIKKKARRNKKKKASSKDEQQNDEKLSDEELPELIWTELAPEISSVLQGNVDLPKIEDNLELNIFNVLSEESKDEQKLTVMKKINLLLYTKRAEESVAIFREARNFFNDDPDDKTFGTFDIQLDEELLALQNILMNDFLLDCNKDEFKKLKKKSQQNENEEDENHADENLIDEEEEENDYYEQKNYKEQLFKFDDFVKLFANQKILQPYCLAFQKYEKNSAHVNSCIIKMFHRLAFDCSMYCMFFQLSFFRTIQNIFKNHYNNSYYIEQIRFNKFIISKFIQVAKTNPNVYIEMFYSKSSKEAYVVEHGQEEVKEPAKRGRKKNLDKNVDEFIEDRLSEEEGGTAAERYDKLFGNKDKKNLESTRLEMELKDNSDLESVFEDNKSIIGNRSTKESSKINDDDDWFKESSQIPDEVIQRRKAKRKKLLAYVKEQNSKEEARSERKKRKSTKVKKKHRKSKFNDQDDDTFDAEVNKNENELNEEIESSAEKILAKHSLFKFLDSDSEDSNDKEEKSNDKIDKKYNQYKSIEDKTNKNGSNENERNTENIRSFEEEKTLDPIEEKEMRSNEFLESDNESDVESKINRIKNKKRKIIESDDEDLSDAESSKLDKPQSKKHKVLDSDEDDTNEKENLSSQSNNFENNANESTL